MPQESKPYNEETALVAFTLAMPVSVGISLVGLLNAPIQAYPAACLAAFLVASIGMVASMAHLARPLRSPFSIIHWRQSWLSREILSTSAYWVMVVAWGLTLFLWPGGARFVNALAVAVGMVLFFMIAQSYRLHTRPAWDGIENVVELFAVLLGPGVAFGILSAWLSPSPGLFWLGVVAVGLGAGLDYWAYRNRVTRLSKMPPQNNVTGTLANYSRLASSIRIAWGLNGLSLLLSIIAALSSSALVGLVLWIVVAVAELASHIIARYIFYALPVQTRFVPRLRGPWSSSIISR